MSSQQIAWFADLVAAAEELGYLVARVGPSEIELHAAKGDGVVIVRSILLSGAFLRTVLVGSRRRKIENSGSIEDLQ